MMGTKASIRELFSDHYGVEIKWVPTEDIDAYGSTRSLYVTDKADSIIGNTEPIVIIPGTYTDRTGENASYNVANQRVIAENYGTTEWLIDITYPLGGQEYAVAIDRITVDDECDDTIENVAQSIVDLIIGLNDYPVLDEEEDNEVRSEWVKESIDSYFRSDVISELSEDEQDRADEADADTLNGVILEALGKLDYGPQLDGEGLYVHRDDMPSIVAALRAHLQAAPSATDV